MNLITISDITFAGAPMKAETLVEYLVERFKTINVACNMKAKKNTIEISQNSEKKLFMSTKINYIPLKAGDKRIKEKGRDFLESERLSEKQLKQLMKIFSVHLDQIHVSCSVKLYNSKTDSQNFVEVRDVSCNNYINNWPMPTSFPLERN